MTAGDSSVQGQEGFILSIPLLFTVIHLWGERDVPVVQGESCSCSTKAAYVQPFSSVIGVFGQWV